MKQEIKSESHWQIFHMPKTGFEPRSPSSFVSLSDHSGYNCSVLLIGHTEKIWKYRYSKNETENYVETTLKELR